MGVGNVIYQKQGRLKITLETGVDLTNMYKTEIIYQTPGGTEVTLDATVVNDTQLTATICPLEDEIGTFIFHAAVTVGPGEEPVLGRAVMLTVYQKYKNALFGFS